MHGKLFRAVLTACACGIAATTIACGTNDAGNRADDRSTTTGTYAQADQNVTLTGCLQKTDGIMADYVLSQASQPSEPVGTTGTTGTVERAQINAAARSYRLSGQSDKLRELVGHEVRVMGTMAARSNLPPADQRTPAAERDRSRSEIESSDLAKVDVTSVESLSTTCRNSRPAAP
jgi:hypothetical protein